MLGLQWTRWILAQLSTSPILSCNRGFQVRSAASFTAARRGVFAWAVSEPMMGDLVILICIYIYMISSNVIYSMKSPRGLVQEVNTTLVGVYVVESIYQKLSMMVTKTILSFFLFFVFFGLSRWLRNRWFSGNDSCLEITVPVLWFICMSWSFPLQSHPSWYQCGLDQAGIYLREATSVAWFQATSDYQEVKFHHIQLQPGGVWLNLPTATKRCSV